MIDDAEMMIVDMGGLIIISIIQTARMLNTQYSQISEESIFEDSYNQHPLYHPHQHIDIHHHYAIHQPLSSSSTSQHQHTHSSSSTSQHASPFEQQALLAVSQQLHLMIELQQRNYYYRSECLKLMEQNGVMRQQKKRLEEGQKHIKDELNMAKDNMSAMQQQKKQHLEKIRLLEQELLARQKVMEDREEQKIRQRERQQWRWNERVMGQPAANNNFLHHSLINSQLLQQQKIIVDLAAQNDQLLKINVFVKQELRRAQEKLIQLEIQVQNKMCQMLTHSFTKLTHNNTTLANQTSPSHFFSGKAERELALQREYKTLQKYKLLDEKGVSRDDKLKPILEAVPYRKLNNLSQVLSIKRKYLEQ